MHVEIAVFEIQRKNGARGTHASGVLVLLSQRPLHRRHQRRVRVEINRVPKFVTFAGSLSFDAGREMRSIVPAHGTLAQTAEQVPQRFVPEKVEAFLGDFEFDISRKRLFDSAFTVAAHHFASLLRR